MSHINFDFLTESILFGSGLEDKFSALICLYMKHITMENTQ